jgi:hypothetical protein
LLSAPTTDVCLKIRFAFICGSFLPIAERLDDVQLDAKSDATLLTPSPTYSVNNFAWFHKSQQPLGLKISNSFCCCLT